MPFLISLLPFILLCIIYACVWALHAAYVKLSARILRGPFVSWKHSFIFAFVIILLTVAGRAAAVLAGVSVPMALTLVFGFALHSTLGGWFFSTRGTTRLGQPLGWFGGVQVAAIAFVFLALTGLLSNGIVRIVGIPVQP